MKYRIVERGDGKYQVQERISWIDDWNGVFCYDNDYGYQDMTLEQWSNSQEKVDCLANVFSTLELAQKKLNNLVAARLHEKAKKKFKVLKEVSV